MAGGKNGDRQSPTIGIGVSHPQREAGGEPNAKKSQSMLPDDRCDLPQRPIAPLRESQRAPGMSQRRFAARGIQQRPRAGNRQWPAQFERRGATRSLAPARPARIRPVKSVLIARGRIPKPGDQGDERAVNARDERDREHAQQRAGQKRHADGDSGVGDCRRDPPVDERERTSARQKSQPPSRARGTTAQRPKQRHERDPAQREQAPALPRRPPQNGGRNCAHQAHATLPTRFQFFPSIERATLYVRSRCIVRSQCIVRTRYVSNDCWNLRIRHSARPMRRLPRFARRMFRRRMFRRRMFRRRMFRRRMFRRRMFRRRMFQLPMLRLR